MITVPKWKWTQDHGWIIEKSDLLNFLELSMSIEGSSFWTEVEFCNLFPKALGPDGKISKVSVMWEILDHQKKQGISAA